MKPRTWFVISLLLLVGAGVFWYWGDRRAERERSGREEGAIPQEQSSSARQGAAGKMMFPADARVAKHFTRVVTNAPNVSGAQARSNALAYRVSNTTQPLKEFMRSGSAVLLRSALIDTGRGAPALPQHLRSADPGSYIVQARGATTGAFQAWLRELGATVVSYVPNNAFLVRASAGTAARIGQAPEVQAVLPFEPYYKFDSMLLPLAVRQEPSPYGRLNVVSFPGEGEAVRQALEGLGGEVLRSEPTPLGEVLVVKAPSDALASIAQVQSVQMVGVHAEKKPVNDLSRVKLRVSRDPALAPPASHYAAPSATDNLTGNGVLVMVADTGVDGGHPDLTGRVFGLTTDFDGHGTHVVGSLIGNGSQSGTVGGDGTNSLARGSTNGANFAGMAPLARAFVQDLIGPDSELQRNAALTNALISNNSWGYEVNDYDIFAASYDAAVRDSLPGVTGEQEVAYVFAAGNDGGGSGDGLNGIAGSILSPATAKNVITVGSTDQARFISNLVARACVVDPDSGAVNCQTNQPWMGETDSDNEISGYSARGNVGIGFEGPFGRFKPDVVAPGSMVLSTRSADYTEPQGQTNTFVFRYNSVPIPFNTTNLYSLDIPRGAIEATILTLSNASSQPTNFSLVIGAEVDAIPTDVTATNVLTLTPPALTPGTMYYLVGNPFHSNTVICDLVVLLTVTNDVGNYYEELQKLNNDVGPYYRYESGTSMAAPMISGMLALFQEYLQRQFNLRPSPALLKALVINGARSLNLTYNLDTHTSLNHQGWGIANISNSIPSGLSPSGTNGPMRFFDQNLTNGLSTGGHHVYQVQVPDEARSYPLRMTLVWTDPPGNPISSVKLVNDLNLSVYGGGTNAAGTGLTSNIWVGNNFPPGSDFTDALVISSTDTNTTVSTNLAADLELVRDTVNNVENVYLRPPLQSSYTIVVQGHRVNVNALNSHSNNIAQDYALVIASGNVAPSNNANLAVTGPLFTNDPSPRIVGMPRATNATSAGLLNQRVGANSALIVSTNGATNQWAFFTYTNVPTANFTNVAIITFLPPELSWPRYREADLDLYVGRGNAALFNLDTATVSASAKATSRGGSEMVVFNNAQPNEVFYIGVKSEDQQAASFGIFAVSSDRPFSSRDSSNNIVANALFAPVPIPDGSPDRPGGTNLFAIVVEPDAVIRRLYVTNAIFHEEAGDLIGTLSHRDVTDGSEAAVTLNNHRTWNGLDVTVYDDSGEGDLDAFAFPPDGPGSLRSFAGQQAMGLWTFAIADNALFHTGSVEQLTLVIEPANTNSSGDGVVVDRQFCILPGRWMYAPVNVDFGMLNMEVCLSEFSGGVADPIAVYIEHGAFPDFGNFDHQFDALPPGECRNIGLGDNPPLAAGRYFIGLYNSNSVSVCVRLRVTLARNAAGDIHTKYYSPTPVRLIDDAVTNSAIFVPHKGRIADLRVGIRVQHDRASDLAFHVVSPEGTRLLLAENRGRTNRAGYGASLPSPVLVTNYGARILESGFEGMGTDLLLTGERHDGWLVENGNIEVLDSQPGRPLNAHTGTNIIDINGAVPGTIVTNISLVPGQTYQLSFAYTRNPDSGPAEAQISVGTAAAIRVISPPPTSWPDLRWITTSTVFRTTVALNRVEIRALNWTQPASGVLFDSVRIDEIDIVTNRYIYAGFTENTNLARNIPIKFAPPPFGSTNILNNLTDANGFEGVAAGEYVAPATFDGWAVRTNQVSVIEDPGLAHSGFHLLALADAEITRTFATTPGDVYTVSFAYRDSGIVSWWPGEGDFEDIAGGNTGVPSGGVGFRSGMVDFGYDVPGDFGNTQVDLGNPENLKLTQSFTIEGWLWADSYPANGGRNHILFRGADDGERDAYKFSVYNESGRRLRISIDNDAINQFLMSPSAMPVGQWFHVAATLEDWTSLLTLYTNGALIAQRTVSIRPYRDRPPASFNQANIAIGNHPRGSYRNPWDGVIDELSVYNRALSISELKAIERAGAQGKYDPIAPAYLPAVAKARVQIGSVNDTLLARPNWQIATYRFVATSNTATLRLSGYALGVLLDSFSVRQGDIDTQWYLPEESLRPVFGQQAFGNWRLEAWDSRLGGFITNFNPQILSWRLDIAYPQTNPPAILLTNGSGYTNYVFGAETRYFVVEVPCSSGMVTNRLRPLSATAAGLSLTFNNNVLPTNGPGDVLLMSGVRTGTDSVLRIGSAPFSVPRRYHLAVRNMDPATTNRFSIHINVDCQAAPLVTLVNNQRFAGNLPPGASQQFVYVTTNDAAQLAFETLDASGDVDLLAQRDAPVGSAETAAYSSRRPGTVNEEIVLNTTSAPQPLAGQSLWYAAVRNVSSNSARFFIKATEARQSSIQSLPLETTLTRSNLAPRAIDYYRVTIPADAANAVFNVSVNAGEADLFIKADHFPTTTLHDYASVMSGSDYFLASSLQSPPLLPGEWRVAVANSSAAFGADYAVTVRALTNDVQGAGYTMRSPVTADLSSGFTLEWEAPAGQEFRVEYTDGFPAQWTPLRGTIVPVDGKCAFVAPGPEGAAQRFYRLIRVR